MSTPTLKLVQEEIRTLRRHGCSDAQIVAILLDTGDPPPDPRALPAGDQSPTTGDAQNHD